MKVRSVMMSRGRRKGVSVSCECGEKFVVKKSKTKKVFCNSCKREINLSAMSKYLKE